MAARSGIVGIVIFVLGFMLSCLALAAIAPGANILFSLPLAVLVVVFLARLVVAEGSAWGVFAELTRWQLTIGVASAAIAIPVSLTPEGAVILKTDPIVQPFLMVIFISSLGGAVGYGLLREVSLQAAAHDEQERKAEERELLATVIARELAKQTTPPAPPPTQKPRRWPFCR